jgi:hypothetical protein
VSRLALSVFLVGALAPTPAAASDFRSLGVTLSPVGAWAATRVGAGLTAGLSAGVDWDYRREGAWTSMGGHVASSVIFSEATPVRVRWGLPDGPARPFVGVGASILLPWVDARRARADASLRLGGEASGGVDLPLGSVWFLAAEGRYQNFSADTDPFSSQRQEIVSAYLGMGFRL